MKLTKLPAALAGLSLLWGTAFAQSEPVQAPELPGVIILELQPVAPGDSEAAANEQAMLGMLLMQLLAALEAEGERPEIQLVVPTAEPGVGI
jgi:hypothetical protein